MKGLYADDYKTTSAQMVCLTCDVPVSKCSGSENCRRLKEFRKNKVSKSKNAKSNN